MKRAPIELRAAWAWDRPECGRENYERAPVCDMPEDAFRPEHQAELRELREQGFEDVSGEYLYSPTRVCCRGCGSQYVTCDEGDFDGDMQ